MRTTALPLMRGLHVDAYLHWAFHTKFRHFSRNNNQTVVLLARFKSPLRFDAKERRLPEGVSISSVYRGYRHATVTVSSKPKTMQDQLSALQGKLFGALCFELGTPEGIPLMDPRLNIELDGPGPEVVVGVIDDGCPFAHKHRRHLDAAPDSLAVRFIWDQGGDPVNAAQPAPFSYGRFFMLDELKAIIASSTVKGEVNEEVAYQKSGLPSLRSITSHGAHVMSLASGWKSYTALRPKAFEGTPLPGATAPAGRKDIAFVQLRTAALDDPSGAWLDQDALDGMQAIRSYARDVYKNGKAHKVVINLSYGPQTGPHDGTSILETAMQEMIRKAPADADPYDLQIVLPSGNNHLQRAHAEFDLARGGGEIRWCVAPDSQLPSYLEIWLPAGVPFGKLSPALISPSGEEVKVKFQKITETDARTAGTIAVPTCQYADRIVILMIVMPTARTPGAVPDGFPLAPMGQWKVRLAAAAGVSGTAHAYLARNDPNLGRNRRGRSGYLDSEGYDPERYRRSSDQLIDDEPVEPAAVLARGSLSGIAAGGSTYVAAGYCATTSLPALYSSGGEARPGGRYGPSWAYPTDQSMVLQGVLATGNRSGAVIRLVGTSFAAPMLGRDLWMIPSLPPSAMPPINPPPPWPSWMHHRFGNGIRE